ncbi:spore-associated protein A [Nocardiopsis ansamitocini]|uniref:Spore-associated protein A n=1 Tax=Nocardiopsis ansamitocini TaxID=1670832 RepID=A0A9W6UGC0_9ACTN|nr:spore-associated protein A [Nocardiopsis ansamitocini]GLU47161.1 spore-associated protein A [Nocardiopsis ansamitocini]
MRKLAAAVLVAGAAMSATVATVGPAAAATYNNACGSGYAVVNSADIGSKGTVFLTYNSSTGYNCAVTVRNSPGSAVAMAVFLAVSPNGAWQQDSGTYTTYAGPVYVAARGACVDWVGTITGTTVRMNGTNCG